MANVEGVFNPSTNGLSKPTTNREKGSSCWPEGPSSASEVGYQADFYDQYLDFDDCSDVESLLGAAGERLERSGGGEGRGGGALGLFGVSPAVSSSPQLSHSQANGLTLTGTAALAASSAPASQGESVHGNSSASSSSQLRKQHPSTLHRATSDTTDYPHMPAGIAATAATAAPKIAVDDVPCPSGVFDTPTGTGSISDSELLNLEGLTMRSPRLNITHHQLPVSASEPASPLLSSTASPLKTRFGALHIKIKEKAAATLQTKSKQSESEQVAVSVSVSQATLTNPTLSMAQIEGVKPRLRTESLDFSNQRLQSASLIGIETTQQPPSNLPPVISPSSEEAILNSLLDNDPFLQNPPLPDVSMSSVHLTNGSMTQTPMQTPLPDPIQSWDLPLTLPDDKALWTTAAEAGSMPYFDNLPIAADPTTTVGTAAWCDPTTSFPDLDVAMDTDSLPITTSSLACQTSTNAQDTALSVSLFLSQPQQPQTTFDYPSPPITTDETIPTFSTTNSMLHMPQPHSILPAAALRAGAAHNWLSHRPKPKAPSSGARHHHHFYNPLSMSLRKTRSVPAPSGSGSHSPKGHFRTLSKTGAFFMPGGSAVHRRSSSLQGLTLGGSRQGLSSSLPAVGESPLLTGAGPGAITKRKSWTGRRAGSSASLHCQYHAHALAAAIDAVLSPLPSSALPLSTPITGSSSSPSKRRLTSHLSSPNNPPTSSTSGGKKPAPTPTDGFVNYTPQDRNLLMTGVAPSGSSKTKARREREAAERQREFRDKLTKMVQAAGGDVSKLGLEKLGIELGLGPIEVGEGKERRRERVEGEGQS
ncbi:uncharacterized protein CTHT_0052150 [Thermochaetoides thermophila DSM 1495]|uniref:Developmental regulatory protein wetA n=1 Tax=Chaetomium thermophilum (strain DSM 1495 / CBS 144.50 / IMI 039719) TaxID=759272 RepID=G0SDK9_CHATD|nr:hypothetical protein CTHT_0052150 [Thermochaetoides thermophila DSM 1495]EGS18610.1 hypothetical protein CTHT_0052150 [Thermochaetoides thermophila DSM 1495]